MSVRLVGIYAIRPADLHIAYLLVKGGIKIEVKGSGVEERHETEVILRRIIYPIAVLVRLDRTHEVLRVADQTVVHHIDHRIVLQAPDASSHHTVGSRIGRIGERKIDHPVRGGSH